MIAFSMVSNGNIQIFRNPDKISHALCDKHVNDTRVICQTPDKYCIIHIMPIERLTDTNRPHIVIWPLSSREVAWKNRVAVLLDGDA